MFVFVLDGFAVFLGRPGRPEAGLRENNPNGQTFGHLFKGSSSPKRLQLSQLVSDLFPIGKLAPLPFSLMILAYL